MAPYGTRDANSKLIAAMMLSHYSGRFRFSACFNSRHSMRSSECFQAKSQFMPKTAFLLLNHQDLSTRLIHLIPPAMAARSKNLKSIFLRRAVLEPQMSAPSAQCHADMRLFEQNDLL